MKLENLEHPSNWQAAYTRDEAFKESDKHSPSSIWGLLLLLIMMSFGGFSTFVFLYQQVLQPYFKLGIILVIILVMVLLFFRVQAKASSAAIEFMTDFYHPPEETDLKKVITNRLWGKFKLPPPLNLFLTFDYIMIREGQIQKKNEWPAWSARHLGGPLLLIVFDGCALYLERGNRFSRVVGPGDIVPFLEWHETIKYVIDLRPKVIQNDIINNPISVWTKDGINIKLKVQIECRIGDPKNQEGPSNLVYPYDPVAVKKAVERYSIRWPNRSEGEPSEFIWTDAAWGQVTGIVPGYISSRMLDDLFIADRDGGQILSPDAVQEIFGNLNNATQGFGVFVTDFQILEIKLPKEIVAVQNEQWKAEKQSIATIHEGEAKAHWVRAHEKARADAQYDIILAIADGLGKNKGKQFTEPVLLSLSGILDENLREPLTRAYMAQTTLDTLEKLRDLLEPPKQKGDDK